MTKKAQTRTAQNPLPSYKRPPVNEVICGFRFEPLQKLLIPHIGLLWEKLRSQYPVAQHAAPISTESSILVDAATNAPLPRVWFISASDNELIQFQGDRFYFNWRQRSDEYPRYSAITQNFETAKRHLDTFVQEHELGPLNPLEYELTYINHVRKGQGWESIDDLSKVFSDMNWIPRPNRFLPNPTHLSWHLRYALPDEKGSLVAKLAMGKRREDDVPVLILEMAAKGSASDGSYESMRSWFDMAREWIVRGFADLTTPEIQSTVWERENA